MKSKYLIFIISVVSLLLVAGCTSTTDQTSTANIVTTTTTELPQIVAQVTTVASTQSWTCVGNGNAFTSSPRTPIIYKQNNPNTPVYQSLPSLQPTPTYTGGTMQNEPIVGTYIFDPSQFKSSDVENLKYFSTLSSSEFYYVVPLDISPDIKWTFRDDGVLLFFQNNITCSDDSLRRFWRNSSGDFLRSGTWKKIESVNNEITYQVTWGCSSQFSHNYIVTYDKNGVRLTQPNVLNMTKIN